MKGPGLSFEERGLDTGENSRLPVKGGRVVADGSEEGERSMATFRSRGGDYLKVGKNESI